MKKNTATLIFLTAFLLFYPFLLVKSPYFSLAELFFAFTPALLALLAIILLAITNREALILTLRANKTLCIPLLLISAIATFHFFVIPEYTFENYMFSLSYILIPLISFMNKNAFLRYSPYFIIILWLLNCYFSGISFVFGDEYAGIARNRNWNACFILASTPFVLFSLYKFLKKYNLSGVITYSILFIPASISLYGMYFCYSRAANITFIFLLFLFYFMQLKTANKKITVLVFVILLTGLSFYIKNTDSLAALVATDVRVPLWEGTINMIKDHWIAGIGPSLFESEFSNYRPVEYHLRPDAAVVTNHPHNHLLFIGAGFGIFGFLSLCFLLFYPILCFIQNFERERSSLVKIYFFALLAIFIHGMLDMVMHQWPTNIMALIFLGILWGRTWKTESPEQIPGPALFSILRHAALLLLSCSLIFFLGQNIIFSKHQQDGMYHSHEKIQRFDEGAWKLQRALGIKKDSDTIYSAGMNSFFKLDNPALTLEYIKMIKEELPGKNVAHSDGFIGNILCMKGRFREALPYLQEELAHYPLSIASWYNMIKLYKILGMEKEEAWAIERLNLCLKYKGLTLKMLPLILENPDYDAHPAMIPEEIRKKYE